MIGGFRRAEVLSFHATKFVNSFEGGAIVTDDDTLAGRARLIETSASPATTGQRPRHEREDERGPRGNGAGPLESADEFMAVNRRNYLAYGRGLAALPGLNSWRTRRPNRTTTSKSWSRWTVTASG